MLSTSLTWRPSAERPTPSRNATPTLVLHPQLFLARLTRSRQFIALQHATGDTLPLPPKRVLATTFIPSAWVDDALITERKAGLTSYLSSLIASPKYITSPVLVSFLAKAPSRESSEAVNPEDALPSTMTRATALRAQEALATVEEESGEVEAKAASPIAAAYYPWWSAWTRTPESLDFSKFDIIFYGLSFLSALLMIAYSPLLSAFVIPNSSLGIQWDSGSPDILRRLIAARNKSGQVTKIVLSVGGWGGCQYFSSTMSSSPNRGTFIANLKSTVDSYGLDGVDVDWVRSLFLL